MLDVGGIPVPEGDDPADNPPQLLAMAEAIDLRLDSLVVTDDTVPDLVLRTAALEAKVAELEVELDFLSVETASGFTTIQQSLIDAHIHETRIEARSVVMTPDSRGFFVITFKRAFISIPILLLTSGSGWGLASANGSNWTGPYAPGPHTHDNTYGGFRAEVISSAAFTCAGMRPGTKMRMNYIAIGKAPTIPATPAEVGGPGWDIAPPEEL